MLNKFSICQRICRGRKTDPAVIEKKKTHIERTPTPSPSKSLLNSPLSNDAIRSVTSKNSSINSINLNSLADDYLTKINHYRSELGYLSLALSKELTNKALNRATILSRSNRMENTPPTDLTWNNQPIGET